MKDNKVLAIIGRDSATTRPVYQWDYGMRLELSGVTLPDAYEVHFANNGGTVSTTEIGDSTGVDIPDIYLTTGADVVAWLYLHTGEADGETVKYIHIPVIKRAQPTHETPTPVQQSEITEAIAALNAAVEKSETNVSHYPKVEDGYWYTWDAETSTWTQGIAAQGPQGETGPQGPQGIQGIQGPQGEQGEKGETGAQGPAGADGKDGKDGADGAAATITVGTTTTGAAGTDASVTNSGTTSAAVLDFTIPRGDKGDKGDTGEVSEAELTNKLMDKADIVTASASGAIASFADGADNLPVKDLTINITPVQSGTGDPSPINQRPISGWTGANVARTGKNLADYPYLIASGCVMQGDGSLYVERSGDFLGKAAFINSTGTNRQFAITFTVKNDSSSRGLYPRIKYIDGTYDDFNVVSSPNVFTTFTKVSNSNKIVDKVYFEYGSYNVKSWFYIQIEINDTATAYEPYNGTTYPITWQTEAGTVYGGTLDVTTGVLTAEWELKDMGSLNWAAINFAYGKAFFVNMPDGKPYPNTANIGTLCSIYPEYSGSNMYYMTDKTHKYGGAYLGPRYLAVLDSDYVNATAQEFKTAVTGQTIYYPLATPLTYQLTPTDVRTLLGENNIWSDTGDSAVTYRADTKKYIDTRIAALQALILNS